MAPPNFIRNNEEWIVWLLDEECSGSAAPRALSDRTAIPLDTLHDNLLFMERVGLLTLERDPSRKYPDEIAAVRLTGKGSLLLKELRERPDPGDLF